MTSSSFTDLSLFEKNKNPSSNPDKKIIIALIGNPNVGKSTLFNELTGGKQYVGNWPGVTVERKEGRLEFNGYRLVIVDLPGTYNLGALSIDEKIAREYIISDKPDVVVDIIDATNLSRNLYLLIELLETGANVVVALNMYDVAKARQIKIDIRKLEDKFNIPFVPTIAIKGEGLDNLLKKLIEVSEKKQKSKFKINYGGNIENAISLIISKLEGLKLKINERWIAIKLLEEDAHVVELLSKHKKGKEIIDLSKELIDKIWSEEGRAPAYIIAEKRYEFIDNLIKTAVVEPPLEEVTLVDLIDNVVTHKIWSIPIFISVLWGMFKFTFDVAAPLVDGIDLIFGLLADYTRNAISPTWLSSLIADGIISGLGSVLIFIPNIFFMFLAMALLEDLGYMARAAYNFDRIMRKLGLHGRSIIPMILGMGCNVPAIMSARTIESEEERLATILVNPLIPCSARLPVFIMLASIFFPKYEALAVLSMYFLGFLLAVLIALFLKFTFFKQTASHFIIELPPYRLPSAKSLGIHMWNRGVHFLKKAGFIILGITIVVWYLFNMPLGVEPGSAQSYAGILGKMIEPILAPLGFDWRVGVALLFGFVAKEIVIDAFGILFKGNLYLLTTVLTPISAFGLMAFVLIYTPCLATLATVKSETTSWKWTAFMVIYQQLLAYALTFVIVQVGQFIFG